MGRFDVDWGGLMYESPIEVIYGEIQTKIENDMVQYVRNYGFNIDKDKLVKALEFDRHNYELGYADAKAEYENSLTFDEIKEIVMGIEYSTPEIEFVKGLILGSCVKKISENNS